MAIDLRAPSGVNEQRCTNCSQLATSVINGNAYCDACAGQQILNNPELSEILGVLLANSLRQQ
jgi:hypothetical protein